MYEVIRESRQDRDRRGLPLRARRDRVPDRGWTHRVRLLLPTDQIRMLVAPENTASADRREPRRSDPAPVAAVVDFESSSGRVVVLPSSTSTTAGAPGTAVPIGSGSRGVGGGRPRRLRQRRQVPGGLPVGPILTAFSSTVGVRAVHDAWPRSPSAMCSRPVPVTTESATSARWPGTPTSSSPATSMAWSARGPSAEDVYRGAFADLPSPTGCRPRSSCSRDSRTRWCHPGPGREPWSRPCGPKGVPFAYLAFEGEQHGFRKAETHHPLGRG